MYEVEKSEFGQKYRRGCKENNLINKKLQRVPAAFWLNDVNLIYPIRGPSSPKPGVLQIRDFTGFSETFSRLKRSI